VAEEVRVAVHSDVDIVVARQTGRKMAARLGFSPTDMTMIATAISELARNIVLYARKGEIIFTEAVDHERSGIVVVARDEGPGIQDVKQALLSGFSTSGSLGLGLPGVRRLMDEIQIDSQLKVGTVVTVKKWVQ